MEVKDSLTIKVNTSEVYDDKGNRWEDLYNDLAKQTECQKSLIQIGNEIATQDNRITDAPLFAVERLRRDYGYDHNYSDDYVWIDTENDHGEASDTMAERLDALDAGDRDYKGWEKVYYKERWEFVMACFTEQGCKDYIKRDGHNLGETRIFAYGSYRNEEYRLVRGYLKSLANAPESDRS